MARLSPHVAQQALQPGNTPTANLSSAVSQELEGLGSQISAFAATMQEREERKQNFKAENDYNLLKLQLEEDLRNQQTEMAPDGTGFYENFTTTSFKPKRDEFLQKLPERLRPQFQAVLNDETGAEAFQWSTRAAGVERDANYNWQRTSITETQNRLATEIALNTDAYDQLLLQGEKLIETSSLPRPEREKLMTDWEHMAQTAILNQMLIDDPQGVLRELGVDARQLSPTTQFAVLSRAVQWQESRDNPNAVSPKGAIGLMQLMPGTAAEVATKLGDANFPHGAPENVIRAYLSNPYINKQYGEAYLQQQLRTFADTRNPIETALVAYNAGPGTAKKWVESGYDDKMLPKETRDYKDNILASISAPGAKGDPSTVRFEGDTKDLSPDLQGRVADAFASIGLEKVRFNSGHRTEAENKAAGGADHSQHLHGNAMDIDVTNMKIEERIELIKALSAAGITGLGIGSNIIHADLGGRRAWGYATSAGGGEVPKWAQATIAEHIAGTTPPIKRIAGRYGNMPYDMRQQFTSKADQLIAQQRSAARSTAVEKTQVRIERDNELALIRATGQGSQNFDETAISTILGEDDYLKFTNDRQVAQQTYTATQGIAQMTAEEMEGRFEEYAPLPGSDSFASQQEVQAAVRKEIDRVQRLRSNRPDKAALELPEVQGAYKALSEKLEMGDAQPAEMQSFVRTMLEAQSQFEIAPEARAPVPREWAVQIGQALARIPETTGRNTAEVQASIYAQYTALQAQFGEYADEVIAYSLSEYTGISKEQAKFLSGYVNMLEDGTNIFRTKAVDQFNDTSQVESFNMPVSGPLGAMGAAIDTSFDFLFGAGEGDTVSAEERLRQQEAEGQ
jgi:hypothetical protein